MIRSIEAIGSKLLSRFVPAVSAAAYLCKCEAGSSWGVPGGRCYCSSDCRTFHCVTGPK
jgi:hypothetical protein